MNEKIITDFYYDYYKVIEKFEVEDRTEKYTCMFEKFDRENRLSRFQLKSSWFIPVTTPLVS